MRRLPVLLLVPVVGCLSYERFLLEKNATACDILIACNPLFEDAGCENDTGVPAAECDFDPGAARDCLNEAWTCSDAFDGFEQAVPPQICDAVCGGPAQ